MPLEIELITIIISTITGILGYMIREYKNKVNPFFEIIHIQNTKDDLDLVTIPDLIMERINNCFYLPPIKETTNLVNVAECWNNAYDFKEYWPDIKKQTDKVLEAESENNFIDNLTNLFSFRYFGIWMVYLLVTNKIDFLEAEISDDIEEKVHIFDSYIQEEEEGGTVLIDFPKNSYHFGINFKSDFVRNKCKPFLKDIRYLNEKSIKHVLQQYKQVVEQEYNITGRILFPLGKIIIDNSHWVFYTYISNINNYPLIISPNAKVIIKGQKGGNYIEDCKMALAQQKKDEGYLETINYATQLPIILQSNSDKLVSFTTNKTQKNMINGEAIREVIVKRQGTCFIEIEIQRIGLIKHQKYRTGKIDLSKFDNILYLDMENIDT